MDINTTVILTRSRLTTEHLRRIAIVYVRQSTIDRRGLNIDAQREQVNLARQYGWPEHLIEFIDDDTDRSGSSVEGRTGWQRLLDRITTGGVGAVFASSTSRHYLGRWPSTRSFGCLRRITGTTLHKQRLYQHVKQETLGEQLGRRSKIHNKRRPRFR